MDIQNKLKNQFFNSDFNNIMIFIMIITIQLYEDFKSYANSRHRHANSRVTIRYFVINIIGEICSVIMKIYHAS